MRFRLRTLLMVLALGPLLLAGGWWLSRSETGTLVLVMGAVLVLYIIGGFAFDQPTRRDF